jgi:hypothetical protein
MPARARRRSPEASQAQNRIHRRLAAHQSVKLVRERDGGSVPAVFRSEGAAQSWIVQAKFMNLIHSSAIALQLFRSKSKVTFSHVLPSRTLNTAAAYA